MSQHRPPNPSHAPPPAGHGGPESARPRSDGLTGAARVATVLAKAAKSSRLYPSEHELRRRFQEELFQTLSSVLEHRPEVRFEIRKHELRVDGHPVFDSEGRDEVIPGLLYWDGLRSLTFRAGLDASELDSFLQLLTDADSLRENGQDDLATLLWDRGFPHIEHLAIDDLLGAEAASFDMADIPVEFTGTAFGEVDMEMHEIVDLATLERLGEQAVRDLFAQVSSDEDTVRFHVSREEVEAIHAELSQENDPERRRHDFLRILAEVLRLSDDPERADTIEILHVQALRRLATGELSFPIDVLQLLHELPDQIDPLGNLSTVARARALSLGMQPAIATQIARHFESDPDAIGELARMVRAVQPSAIPTLCEMLGSFESATARRRLIDLLVEIGAGHVDLLQPFLEDQRWYLVRNVALILGEIGDEAAVESLRVAITHRDPRVRKEVAKAVGQCAAVGARALLVHVLHDPDSTLRRWAARTMAAESSAAAPLLRKILESKEFEERDAEEQADFWEAYAYAGRARAVTYLQEELEKKKLWRFIHSEPERAALCLAIGIAGGPVARRILQGLRKDRSADIRAAVEAALERMDAAVDETPRKAA